MTRCRMFLGDLKPHFFVSLTMSTEEFDDATKQRFMEEDSEAWNSICTILMGIISVGLVLACLAVYLVS